MERDITNITPQPCNVLVDNQTINTYDGFYTYTYKMVSDKYYLYDTNDYSGLPVHLNCMTTEEISHLPSNYDFITPIFHLASIFSIIVIVYFAYRLIIYPFFRKR